MDQHLLLLHGALGSKKQLEPLIPFFQDKFTVHSFNFSGHGGSQIPDRYSIELFSEDILNYLDVHKISSAYIMGYSMGGYAALYFSSFHPQRVVKIFILATKFDWTKESAEKESKMLLPEKIMEKIPAYADALSKRHIPQDWKMVLRKTADMMLAMGSDPPLSPELLAKIKLPVMIGVGDADKMVSVAESEKIRSAIENAELYIMPKTPHPIEQVSPAILSAKCTQFFLNN